MSSARAATLAKRTTFSSAINILSTEIGTIDQSITNRLREDTIITPVLDHVVPKPYANIPGPKELPFIGNSWRFAPIIGKLENLFLFILIHPIILYLYIYIPTLNIEQ